MKSHIQRFINEGHDVTTANQMWDALSSYGGIRGVYASVLSINKGNMVEGLKWPGVTGFSNFSYDGETVRVWASYDMGDGKDYSVQQLAKDVNIPSSTGYECGPYTQPHDETGFVSSRQVVLVCPENGCLKSFSSDHLLTHHLSIGDHNTSCEACDNRLDKVARKWAGCVTEVTVHPGAASIPTETVDDVAPEHTLTAGWALRSTRTSQRFSDNVREFLLSKFMEGVKAKNKKQDPAQVAKMLRSHFCKNEWLTAQQVNSYFSRLSILQKCGKLPAAKEPMPDEDEQDTLETMVYRQKLRRRVVEMIESC
jgi:hypothetical protein